MVDKPSNNEDNEEIPSSTGEGIILKIPLVRNNPRPRRSSQSKEKNNTNQILKGNFRRCNFY